MFALTRVVVKSAVPKSLVPTSVVRRTESLSKLLFGAIRREARSRRPVYVAVGALFLCASVGIANPVDSPSKADVLPQAPKLSAELCALLDDPDLRVRMDGLLYNLLRGCGRSHELGGVESHQRTGEGARVAATDQLVNDRTGEAGISTTQSETSMAENPNTGTLCSAFNDSFEIFSNNGLTGFGRSTDDGATWTDGGPVGDNTAGDPALAWSERDSAFYIATLSLTGGLELNVSTDDCQSFSFAGTPATGGDDKELIAIDNNPGSPFFGRIYVAWADFGAGARIAFTHSDDSGATWTPQINLSDAGDSAQSAWPVVAPNGDVFVAWVHWFNDPNETFEIEVTRSTNGGASFNKVTPPSNGETEPRDATWSGTCGRPALNGGIRYSPFPQLAVGSDGVLHVAYSYDPDGLDTGDIVNVYYRRSVDNGATWGPEIRLNDVTTNDQYSPTLSVGAGGVVMATWYDRRLDPGNLLQDVFRSISTDNGLTWGANERLTDASSPIELDPILTTCYHGDYDTSIVTSSGALVAQWSDDRNTVDGRNDPDVWTEALPATGGFVLSPPNPGAPGAPNTWAFTGAAAGAEVFVILGRDAGSTPVPGCPGLNLTIANTIPIDQTIADGSGAGSVTRDVPPGASGTFFFEAVDRTSCAVSNRVVGSF